MITLECASLKGFLDCASLAVSKGRVCAVLTETEFEKDLLLRIFTGLTRLDSGRIFLFGKEMSSLSSGELNGYRKRIGIVLNNGGLISNLKVRENIMLPLSYHSSSHYDADEKMTTILDKIGYDDDVAALPGPLPAYQKRLAGFARAVLMEPDLVIYDSVFDGLSPDIRGKVLETITAFHHEKEGRASLFLDMDEGLLNYIRADDIYILKKGKFYERN
ncbi:MAG: ATP-binding cassette domain-containing protein [Thermodesulfovibrionales bacterium]|nr:ATP-binding cassette domain-containing protein [Thermodesulfovibrionales bacterium]